MKLKNKYLGVIISIIVLISATGVSYLALSTIFEPDIPENDIGIQSIQSDEKLSSHREDTLMVSFGIGIAMGLIALASWQGSQSMKKDPAELLLDEGLENMTVKDLVIVRRLIQKEEFTIPQLVKNSPVSRSSIWRLVKKLDEKGLIEEKNESEMPDGTRGKPSKVYRFVGPNE